jgi:hypothetical protein
VKGTSQSLTQLDESKPQAVRVVPISFAWTAASIRAATSMPRSEVAPDEVTNQRCMGIDAGLAGGIPTAEVTIKSDREHQDERLDDVLGVA